MNLTTNLRTAFAALAFLPGALTACGSSSDAADDTAATSATTTGSATTGATTGATSTTGGPSGCISGTAMDGSLSLLIDPANNYAFDSTVTLRPIAIAPNASLNFDWSALTIDITKQPINPAGGEVAAVLLSLLELTVQEFEAKLNANENLTNYSKGALAFYPTTETSETSANIYEFGAPGNAYPALPEEINPYLDPVEFPPDRFTYALLVQDSTEPAHGVRMVQALQMDPNSLNTDVAVTNDSSGLEYHTDLVAVAPVQVPVGNANITADWTALEDVANNALGDLWLDGEIQEVMVGHYLLTPAELTAQFLGLENIAEQLYRGPVAAGSKLNLSTLVEETTSAPFTGIDATGTWILALNCTDCTNPAPWFLTILTPCP